MKGGDAFLRDVHLAVRALARRPAFTAVAAGSLTLGLGSATAIFSVVDGVLLRPLDYRDPATLVTLWRVAEGTGALGRVSWADFLDWRKAAAFSSVAAYEGSAVTLTGLGEPEVLAAARVSPHFFRVFAASPVLGRSFAPEESLEGGPAVAVLSHRFWQRRLASDPGVLSRTIELDGRPHQVVGVAPPRFDYPRGAEVWIPVQNPGGCGRECRYLRLVARLAPGTPLARARKEMETLGARLQTVYPEAYRGSGVAVVPLREVVVGDARPGLLLVLGAVGLVFLIGCGNVANLLLVRGEARTGEVTVRSALGAERPRIVGQLLTESFVLALVAGPLGLLLAAWGVDLLRAAAPPGLPRMAGVGIDVRVVGFAAVLAVATALLVGAVPALRVARTPATGALDARRRGGGDARRSAWGRTLLLVPQVAFSLVLLTAAALLLRSARRMDELDPGFDPEGVLTFDVSLPPSRYPGPGHRIDFLRTLEGRLAADSRVEAVGSALGSPLGSDVRVEPFRPLDLPVPRRGRESTVVRRVATPGYFRTLRIPLVEGRLFDERDGPAGPRVMVVSQAAARRFWPDGDPVGDAVALGSSVRSGRDVARVVGIVGDVRSVALTRDPTPEVYVPFAQDPVPRLTVHVRALPGVGGAEALTDVARSQVWALDADLPLIAMDTLEGRIREATARTRFYLILAGLFAVVTVALAAVGLYGVAAYLTSRRGREIGIRMALGAEDRHVVRLVVREGLLAALAGIGVGVLGIVAMARPASSFLFGVDPLDPRTLGGVAAVVLAVVLGASLVPARGARRTPPSEGLRMP